MRRRQGWQRAPVASLALIVGLGLAACGRGDTPPPPEVVDVPQPVVPVVDDRHPTVIEADDLVLAGYRTQAIDLLTLYTDRNPQDADARRRLRELRIDERKDEISALLSEQADLRGSVLGDPLYEHARAAADEVIVRQLEMVEFLIDQERYEDAVSMTQQVIETQPEAEAALILMERLMDHLLERERANVESIRDQRRGQVLTSVVEDATVPLRPDPIARTVLIFDEDLEELEQVALMQRLRQRVPMVNYREAQLRDVLEDLFAVAGLNYVLLDSSLSDQTLTIYQVDETVEHLLEIASRMVDVRFNYRGGSVYVTDSDSPILINEVIRLKSGLTDVQTPVEMLEISESGDDDEGGGGDGGNINPADIFGGGGDEPTSDVERFLVEILDGDPPMVDWPDGSRWYLDRKTNTLVLHATPAAIAEVKRLLHAVDVQPPQVLIEAKFVEVTDEAAYELGVDWAFGFDDTTAGGTRIFSVDPSSPLGGLPPQPGAGVVQGAPAGIPESFSTGGLLFGVARTGSSGLNFEARLSALAGRNEASVLSEPKILTVNNSVGMIDLRQEFAYISDYDNRSVPVTVDSGDGGGTVNVDNQNILVPVPEKETQGITLAITPSIARNDDIITLRISPSVRELLQVRQFPFQDPSLGTDPDERVRFIELPIFDTRRIATQLNVRDGQTIVLGGLVTEDDIEGREGIPGLQDIPGFGQLFRTDVEYQNRRKLLIFVTAHLIDPTGASFTDEVRHLRDTARTTLPMAVREREAARLELEADAAAEAAREARERRPEFSTPPADEAP